MKPPLEMPTDFFAQVEFDIQRVDYSAADAGGRVGGVQAGFPLWAAVYTIDTVGQLESDAIRAFKDQMRGSIRLFLGRDLLRPYPKAHSGGFAGMIRAGGGAFDGTATTWSQTTSADGDCKITLNGLPVGLQLGQGDYIGFHWVATDAEVAGLTWHAAVRAVEAKVASGAGVITDIICEPPIPSAVPGTAIAYLNQPACVMRLTDQTKLQAVGKRLAIGGGQIAGIQDIRA